MNDKYFDGNLFEELPADHFHKKVLDHATCIAANLMFDAAHPDLGKPDWDNIGKLICDALNGVAYTDDAHVVMGGVQKGCRTPYGTPPLAKVCITHFTEEYVKEKKK